jgi:hypothetical protein
MGGFGSGRIGYRAKCEGLLSIDARRWAREGYLSDPGNFPWFWTLDRERHYGIRFWVHEKSCELDYKIDGESYRYPVYLSRTRCFFGGERIWFRCPIDRCGRRVAKLYLGSRYFACRRCYGLAYQSQCYSPSDRAMTQAGKIRRSLGGSEGIAWDFPDKPKGMHWRTYERLRERCDRYEAICDTALWQVLGRMMAKQR